MTKTSQGNNGIIISILSIFKAFSMNTYFFLNDLFIYIAIDTVFHPSGIIQNGRRKLLSKSHGQSFNYIMNILLKN